MRSVLRSVLWRKSAMQPASVCLRLNSQCIVRVVASPGCRPGDMRRQFAAGDRDASLYGRAVAKDLQAGALAGEADTKSALALNAHGAATFADYGVKP